MTERESEGDREDYPDGSVGRYVREQWGASPRRQSRGTRPYVGPVQPAPEAPEEDVVPEPRSESTDAGATAVEATGPAPAAVPQASPTRGFPSVPPPPPRVTQRPGGTGPVPPFASVPPASAPPPTPPAPSPSLPAPRSQAAPPLPAAPVDTPPRGTARWTDPGAVAAQEAQQARNPGTSDLSSVRLLKPAKRPPQSGWRRMVYVLSGRMINPGESQADVHRRELTVRVNQPLLGCYKIAMLSLKGGVGKTTVTATLGATFSSLRGDRVVAVDANPDRGTLSQKIPLETSATVRNLLRDAQRVRRYTDVRAYTSQGPSRLEVLASEQDPAVSEAFSEDDYRRTVNLLEHFYNIVLTDCGTGLMHSAMYGVLGVADQLIVVSSGSIDGARSASATMDWLEAHGHGDLVSNAVAVINCVHRSAGGVDLDRVAEHFEARCRQVVRIPFDAHLEEGAEVDLERLEPATRLALLELAAAVADAFEGAPTG